MGTDIHSNSCEQVHVRMNSSDACSERYCTDAVLENMYRSLGDGEGGVQVCIREALAHFREIDHTTRVKVCAATKSPCVPHIIADLSAIGHCFHTFEFQDNLILKFCYIYCVAGIW